MAHPVVFGYPSYSTTLSEHAVHRLRQLDGQSVSDPLTGWPHDRGPTNVRAMVKKISPETAAPVTMVAFER